MKVAIVTTTINTPLLFEKYFENFSKSAIGKENVTVVITSDKKTPPTAEEYCISLSEKFAVKVVYQNIEWQNEYLNKYPELKEYLPFNSIQRRNVAILYSYEIGCDYIITIDDDNFLVEGQDFIAMHLSPFRSPYPPGCEKETVLNSTTGWVNVCDFLEEKNNVKFYHRGYPISQRWKDGHLFETKSSKKVLVNAGFWLEDPDVDAITRLVNSLDVVKYTQKKNIILNRSQWSPFNSQNTCLSREIIPCYFLSASVGRFDDIWASYIILKAMDSLDSGLVSYGFPLVRQIRNDHNYFRDHEKEHSFLENTDLFCETLRSFELKSKTFQSIFSEIREKLEEWNSSKENSIFTEFIKSLEVWEKTINRV